jgi:hypothetical protein
MPNLRAKFNMVTGRGRLPPSRRTIRRGAWWRRRVIAGLARRRAAACGQETIPTACPDCRLGSGTATS